MKTRILEARQIRQKTDRMAYQILETFYKEERILLAGIAPQGYEFAQRIALVLNHISIIQVTVVEITMHKKTPWELPITVSKNEPVSDGLAIVLVDDVLNTGLTMMYAIHHFLSYKPKALKTAVLVDRDHKNFPVHADFVGLALSTNLQEHVEVVFGENEGVYLQ